MQSTRQQLLLGVMSLLVSISAGCSSMPAVAPPVNPAQAVLVLEAALTAWRDGQAITDVVHASQPVVVQDVDWLQSRKLNSFQLVDRGTAQDANLRIDVVLTFAEPSENTRVTYIVGTAPKQTVFRAFE